MLFIFSFFYLLNHCDSVLCFSLPVQIRNVSQDFMLLQQKLNQIIMAHQINPSSNGMFTRGQAGADQQLSGKRLAPQSLQYNTRLILK